MNEIILQINEKKSALGKLLKFLLINLLQNPQQALLAIRLCGTVLDQEVQTDRSELVASIWNMVIDMKLPLTVVHYNALLRVHLENRCVAFAPFFV